MACEQRGMPSPVNFDIKPIQSFKNNNITLHLLQMCLGDVCCATTVGSLQLLVPLLDRHAKIGAWMSRLRQLPCFQTHLRGVQRLKAFVDATR